MVQKICLVKIAICIVAFLSATPVFKAMAADPAALEPFTMYTPGASIDSKVENSINLVFSLDAEGAAMPGINELAPLVEYMVTANGTGDSPHPETRPEGRGIYYKQFIDKPFKTALRYFYNPKIASELLYPATIRRGFWLPDSEFLHLKKPLWDMVDDFTESPLVVRGAEYEEITPDNFSGSYYIYEMNRIILMFRYKGVPMVMSVIRQDGESESGKKGGFIKPYNNWDFVFTKDEGGTATGLGWLSTYMYASNAIFLFYQADEGRTGYAMFKWLKAGWSGINAVKRSHMLSGANRNFTGMLDVTNNKTGLSVEQLEEISNTADAYERNEMLELLESYSQELARLSLADDILNRDEFQELLSGGKYIQGLSDDELRSLMKITMLKRKLGKPVLGG